MSGSQRYANHEGVPETEEVGDYFREVTLFRRHPAQVPSVRYDEC